MNKSFYYFNLAANNEDHDAKFYIGFMYMKGEYVSRDINQAIHYYKEASSFNHQYAKVNLSFIYRHCEDVKQNLWYSIELLTEAIKQKDDPVAKYNLSHIYLYEKNLKYDCDDIIKMLIESIQQQFEPSSYLLVISIMKKYGNLDHRNIKQEIKAHAKKENIANIKDTIYRIVQKRDYKSLFEKFRSIDFIYDISKSPIISIKKKPREKINEAKQKNGPHPVKINSVFYEGFGIPIDL